MVQTQGADQTWSLKDSCLKYLEYDLFSLFDVLVAANSRFFLDYSIQMTESNTISKMALELFIVDHYKDNIPLIDNKTLFNDIKLAYYGGCTEVYRPFRENLYYYDVNSLYPFASLNDMPGLECTYMLAHQKKGLDLDNLFGFFYQAEPGNRILW